MKNLFFVLSLGYFFTGCAPSFSDYQGADVVGKGNIGLNLYTSKTSVEINDEADDSSGEESTLESSGKLQDSNGIRFSYGLSDKMDAQFEYEIISAGLIKGNITTFGIKYNFYKSDKLRISTCLPISFGKQEMESMSLLDTSTDAVSQDGKIFEPTILFSYNLFKNFDFNMSTKFLKAIDKPEEMETDDAYALNFGGSLSLDKLLKIEGYNISILYEYGLLDFDGQTYNQSGLGLSIKNN